MHKRLKIKEKNTSLVTLDLKLVTLGWRKVTLVRGSETLTRWKVTDGSKLVTLEATIGMNMVAT